ncbi:MAG: CTP synthase [Acidobacteria bacterium]|nr:CTP synthase [Acidobacteriota bacterium]
MNTLRIGVIGDFDSTHRLHGRTNDALRLAAGDCEIRWLATDGPEQELGGLHGFFCAPGSPYRSMDGALRMVRWARESGAPFLGTCGGAQHALIEFARGVMGMRDAGHAEYDPYASVLFVNRLACSLVGRAMAVELRDGSRAAAAYGERRVTENYYCNFGLNGDYRAGLEEAGMLVSGWDDGGEARVFELAGHPFFLATLFVPQDRASEAAHPLIRDFVRAARDGTA